MDRWPQQRQWRRVDQPTTKIVGEIARRHENEQGFAKAQAGLFGPEIQEDIVTFNYKHPIGGALYWTLWGVLVGTEEDTPTSRAAKLTDAEAATRHIKDLAYFLRADDVGICELPPGPCTAIATRAIPSTSATSTRSQSLSIRTIAPCTDRTGWT